MLIAKNLYFTLRLLLLLLLERLGLIMWPIL
jgi:hypothetical protein